MTTQESLEIEDLITDEIIQKDKDRFNAIRDFKRWEKEENEKRLHRLPNEFRYMFKDSFE